MGQTTAWSIQIIKPRGTRLKGRRRSPGNSMCSFKLSLAVQGLCQDDQFRPKIPLVFLFLPPIFCLATNDTGPFKKFHSNTHLITTLDWIRIQERFVRFQIIKPGCQIYNIHRWVAKTKLSSKTCKSSII